MDKIQRSVTKGENSFWGHRLCLFSSMNLCAPERIRRLYIASRLVFSCSNTLHLDLMVGGLDCSEYRWLLLNIFCEHRVTWIRFSFLPVMKTKGGKGILQSCYWSALLIDEAECLSKDGFSSNFAFLYTTGILYYIVGAASE